MEEPKYPEVQVQLVGLDGNAFSILSRVMKAMRRADVPHEEIKQFQEEATSGDYNNLLMTCVGWVSCDGVEEDE